MICCEYDNIYGVLQTSSQPRAIGFSIHNPNLDEEEVTNVVLISKKHSWFRRREITNDAVIWHGNTAILALTNFGTI